MRRLRVRCVCGVHVCADFHESGVETQPTMIIDPKFVWDEHGAPYSPYSVVLEKFFTIEFNWTSPFESGRLGRQACVYCGGGSSPRDPSINDLRPVGKLMETINENRGYEELDQIEEMLTESVCNAAKNAPSMREDVDMPDVEVCIAPFLQRRYGVSRATVKSVRKHFVSIECDVRFPHVVYPALTEESLSALNVSELKEVTFMAPTERIKKSELIAQAMKRREDDEHVLKYQQVVSRKRKREE